MAVPLADSNNSSHSRIFFDAYRHHLRRWLLGAGCIYLLLLLAIVAWFVDATRIGIIGLSEFGSIVVEYLIVVVVSILIVGFAAWKLYFAPRSAAYSGSAETLGPVRVLGGKALLVLSLPKETYVLLKNKQIAGDSGDNGGERLILPALGEEAIGPISLRTEMLPWTDKHVLTREAQPLEIALGLQWHVSNAQKYVFGIKSDVHRDATKLIGDFVASKRLASENTVLDPRRPATSWLYLWVESAVRSYISKLGIADIILSATALQWLQLPDDGAIRKDGKFEEMANAVVTEVNQKAIGYGLHVEGVSVQGIRLPEKFQNAIDRTREAFLKPISSEQEAKARAYELSGELETLKKLLGDDAFRMNELLKNFRGANFSYFPFQEIVNQFLGKGAKAAGAGDTELSGKSGISGGISLDKKTT